MKIKKILRRFGFDIIRYHSFWNDIAKPRGIKTILDIGAHAGESALAMREYFPQAHIISFEPIRGLYERLVEAMKGDTLFHSYNLALGEKSGETVIRRSASTASSSLLPMAGLHKKLYPDSVAFEHETIRVERLDEVLHETTLEHPLLVKIDVQGFEADVIRGGTKTLSQADIVVVENSFVTLYEGQALFDNIHDLMRSLGFSYRGRSETHYNPLTKEPIYEDSVFIKES